MTDKHLLTAARRFAKLLTSGGVDERDVLAAGVVVERCGFDGERGVCLETFEGATSVCDWASRSPAGSRFTIESMREGSAQYTIEVAGFIGGGTWMIRLDDNERLLHITHQPDDLAAHRQTDDEWRRAIAFADAESPPSD